MIIDTHTHVYPEKIARAIEEKTVRNVEGSELYGPITIPGLLSTMEFNGIDVRQVLYYYDVTLPQFGWNKVVEAEGGHYYRKGENLEISFDEEEGQSLIKIMIHPCR